MKFRKLLLLAMSNPNAVSEATTKWIFAKPGRTDISRRRVTNIPSKEYLKRAQVLIWDGDPKWESIAIACESAGIEVVNTGKAAEEKTRFVAKKTKRKK